MRKMVLASFSVLICFSSFFVSGKEGEVLKRLDLIDSAMQSAESSDNEQDYKKIKPIEKEPPVIIRSSGYFEEPEFIPEPEIIKEGEEKKPVDEGKPDMKYDTSILGQKLVALAQKWMKNGVRSVNINGRNVAVYNDCSNFVRAIYWNVTGKDIFYESQFTGAAEEEKIKLSSGVALLYAYFKRKQHYSTHLPRVGDVIFFDNTWDSNNNKRNDDYLTHVGLVTGYDKSNGTVTFIHANTGQPKNIYPAYLNKKYPTQNKLDGKTINSYLRRKYTWDQSHLQFAGQLTRGYGGF